ncbi:hypothetical protein OG896_25010 [Streptomyces sp. NBC_00669]|uniref:hypothetical protein n=1 Tax=Streptomyces sp. NBC_00669 TaxID=2976011 RepID=UPI002E323802|nr:hypothetical protein [Streptomyces sp. NBC_00669]
MTDGMTDLQNFTVEETAGLLRCGPRHLEDNLSRYPHQKIGQAVAFDAADILRIKEMCRVEPASVESTTAERATTAQRPRLADIRPAPPRRRNAS